MKKIALCALIAMGTTLSAFAADPKACPITQCPHIQIINLRSLSNEQLEQLLHKQLSDVVVEISANSTIALHFFLEGNLLSLIGDSSLQLLVKETLYMRCEQNKMLFSLNLMDWKPFQELVTGNITVSLLPENGEIALTAGAELYIR